jgi:hypothetical protein
LSDGDLYGKAFLSSMLFLSSGQELFYNFLVFFHGF